MRYLIPFMLCVLSAPAFAADAPPTVAPPPATVTLTQDQLARLIQAEQTKAVTNYVLQMEAAKAKDAYDIVQKAFAPKPSPPPESDK